MGMKLFQHLRHNLLAAATSYSVFESNWSVEHSSGASVFEVSVVDVNLNLLAFIGASRARLYLNLGNHTILAEQSSRMWKRAWSVITRRLGSLVCFSRIERM